MKLLKGVLSVQIEFLKKQPEDTKLQAEGSRRLIEIAESELKIRVSLNQEGF